MTSARSFSCPACGGALAIKAAGYTVSVGCQYCGSELDVAQPEVKLIQQYHEAVGALDLPIGSRGTVRGVEWEVIGYLQRSDDEAAWSEYLLFNPYAGYRWLIRAGGEWTFGTMLTELPQIVGNKSADFSGVRYRLDYDPVPTRTDKVIGEFYWRARAGDTVDATMYRRGRGALSWERGVDEVSWTLIETVSDQDVLVAFGKAEEWTGAASDPRQPRGKGARNLLLGDDRTQSSGAFRSPNDDVTDLIQMWSMWFGAVFVIWLILGISSLGGRQATQTASIGVEQPAKNIPLATLTLTRPYQVVTVDARSSEFVNKWIDLDYSLINRKTQQSISAYGLVEFYSGRDSDGNWTEGNRRALTKFAGVPAGTYDLMVDAQAHRWVNPRSYYYPNGTYDSAEPIFLRFSVAPNGMFFSNVLLFGILMFVPVGWFHYRRSQRGYRYRE